MILSPAPELIPLVADGHRVMRDGNTRVTLDTVIAAFADGATAEVDAYLHQRRVQRDAVRQQKEARFDPRGVRKRFLARRASHGP